MTTAVSLKTCTRLIMYWIMKYSYLNYTIKLIILVDNLISSYKMDHPVTLEEERKVWTIHQSVNGTTYYYNRATKKSQY